MIDKKKISQKFRIIGLTVTMIMMMVHTGAEDLRKVVSLTGPWKFTVGDSKSYSAQNFDDSKWDDIRVPGKWEDNGYSEYNGYAWYRKSFSIPDVNMNIPLYLILGRIDDVDEVYLNGKSLGRSGSFPPDYQTAYNVRRKYLIPSEYLKPGNNTIAIRVYDNYLEGGIIDGPVGIYTDEDFHLLELDLSGKWKFNLGDNKQWKSPSYNDDMWEEIFVPAEWEKEGYSDYDGYAWYRRSFKVPSGFKGKDLYLVLGKIDDYDYVFLNGEPVGSVFDLKKDNEYKRKGYEYNARRIYKIPAGLLRINEVNTIAIRVYDMQWRGGIYEGPVGIMNEENCRKYRNKYYQSQTFWDFVLGEFFIDN